MSRTSREQVNLETFGGKRMRNKVLLVFLALILAVVPLLAACPAPVPPPPVEPIKLTYANFPPAPTFPCVQMERWADEVEARTNGKVIIETFPGGTLLGALAMFDGVLAGVADIGISCPGYEPGRFPVLAILDLPVGLPNTEVASYVMAKLVKELQPPSVAEFKVLTAFTSAPAYIHTIDPVRNLEDLKGMELRATGAAAPILEALGGVPIAMPMTELPEALAKGVVKGYLASREVLMDFKFAEIVHYVTDYSTGTVAFLVVMNKDTWNALPADVKKVMDDLYLEQAVWTGEYMDGHVKESLKWSQEEHGLQIITLSPEEQARWDALLEPAVDKWVEDMEAEGLPGQEMLDRLYELKEEYSK